MSSDYNKNKDPNRTREETQYENPVQSREFIIDYLDKLGRPASLRQLLEAFQLERDTEREGLRRRLLAMVRDGQLVSTRRDRFGLVSKMQLVRGRVQGHRDGYGFLIPDAGGDDIFLPAREMHAVFPDDIVLVRVLAGERRAEGVIVDILERHTETVVGRYYEEGSAAWVDPTDQAIAQDILVLPEMSGGAKPGQFVVVSIANQPTRTRQALGAVVEVLGDHMAAGMEVEVALRAHDLPFRWSEAVEAEVACLPSTVQASELEGRADWRVYDFVTIDGEDARDFDDAVYATTRRGGGFTLYVAIADVAHYVRLGSELDKEAERRGNSVYFPSRVIPMLPEGLSNELCSLKPNVDRLVLGCEMRIDKQGEIQSHRFCEAVIHSRARLTYTQVATALQTGETPTFDAQLLPHLRVLYAVFQVLLSAREVRGAIDFETQETKIQFDDHGKIERIVPSVRNDAHRLIEEAMLAANVSTAVWLLKAKIPALYRVHEGPPPQKLTALKEFLKGFSLRLTGGAEPEASDYARLLARISQRPEAHLLQTVMLRSLQQAVYQPDNVGHFGLAYHAYCHFTSPIRRYPDLLVHRAIKWLLHHTKCTGFVYDEKRMLQLGMHCSMTERRADRATRDALDWLKCEYMLDKVGQQFSGRIIEVTSFGLFVELDEVYVQGLLHITALRNDYYQYDLTQHRLLGERSGTVYQLGNAITVVVARVDLDNRKIDFELPDSGMTSKRSSKQSTKAGKKKNVQATKKRPQKKRNTKR